MAESRICRGHGTTVTVLLLAAVFVFTLSRLLFTADQSSVANSPGSRVTPSLEFVIIVTRHGNRGPAETCPKCPYKPLDPRYWPNGHKNLTQKGITQMYQLGAKIRSLYNGFLDEIYYPHEFQANSTPVDRTLSSGQAFLAGLYPPRGFQGWKKGLPWQPVPLHPTYLDYSAYGTMNEPFKCTIYEYSRHQTYTKFERDCESKMSFLLSKVQPYTGFTNTSSLSSQIYSLWEGLFFADNEGYPLPAWASLVYPEPLQSLSAKDVVACNGGSYLEIRFSTGLLFQAFVKLLRSRVEGTADPARKMQYVSAHDSTIVGLLGSLGVTDTWLIKPRSALIYELHRLPNSRHHVDQVLYIDGASSNLEPRILDIPNCGSPCHFYFLANATETYYNISNFLEECQLSYWIPST